MNKDQAMGEWDEFKGRVKKAYAELTDDDCARASGSKDKLLGIIEQKFGDAKEKVLEKIRSIHVSDAKR
jgi:uncharacterized protein YjbJ (UPF0337 family)